MRRGPAASGGEESEEADGEHDQRDAERASGATSGSRGPRRVPSTDAGRTPSAKAPAAAQSTWPSTRTKIGTSRNPPPLASIPVRNPAVATRTSARPLRSGVVALSGPEQPARSESRKRGSRGRHPETVERALTRPRRASPEATGHARPGGPERRSWARGDRRPDPTVTRPVGTAVAHPATVLGLGDGGAHVDRVCGAGYPSFVLVRECARALAARDRGAGAHDRLRPPGWRQADRAARRWLSRDDRER